MTSNPPELMGRVAKILLYLFFSRCLDMIIKFCILGPIPKGFFYPTWWFKIVGEKIGQNFNSYFLSLEISTKLQGFKLIFSGLVPGAYSGGGLWGLSPPWTSEIYWFHGVFRPQRVLSPPWKDKQNLSPSPLNKFLNTPLTGIMFKYRFSLA